LNLGTLFVATPQMQDFSLRCPARKAPVQQRPVQFNYNLVLGNERECALSSARKLAELSACCLVEHVEMMLKPYE
jgi:hypothetical protein